MIALTAIYNAQKSGQFKGSLFHKRSIVAKLVGKVKFKGATGTTSFDKNGDTTNRIISLYAVLGGKWVYKGQAPKITGISPT
jgi:ABC-type branched-subunit amino acid transport system substrate-binding protein